MLVKSVQSALGEFVEEFYSHFIVLVYRELLDVNVELLYFFKLQEAD